jgi:hypothetical protein
VERDRPGTPIPDAGRSGAAEDYGMDRRWGPALVAIGLLLVVVGLLAWGGALRWLGRLPGDLRFGSEHVRVYIPITSMLLVSVVVSILIAILVRLVR